MGWDKLLGASLQALEGLGARKGTRSWAARFRNQRVFRQAGFGGGQVCAPFTAENHFEPPRFGFYKAGALDTHPAGVRKYEIV